MLYEFRCENCGESFDKNIPLSAAIRSKCPVCRSKSTRRIFSVPSVFIGSEDRFTKQLSGKGKDIWNKHKAKAGL